MIPILDGPLLYPPLSVRLLPPYEAYNYEHIRDGLADPRLAAAGVAIQVHRMPLLAVPIGGRPRWGLRRGGYFIAEQQPVALAVCDLLAELRRADFSELRIRQAPGPTPPGPCWVVEWGDPAPDGNAQARARFYGYSDRAIATDRFSLPPLPIAAAAAPTQTAAQCEGTSQPGALSGAPLRADAVMRPASARLTT